MTPEIAQKIIEVRLKVARGEYSLDDIAEALKLYREARGVTMANVHKKATEPKVRGKAAHKAAPDDLLNSIIGEAS
jgi:hypothetical protein